MKYEVISEENEFGLPVGTFIEDDIESVNFRDSEGNWVSTEQWPMAISSSYLAFNVYKIDEKPEIYREVE